ncbi:hypothetical protein AC578_4376 [Pseudocercospora eumusae]|uniref:Uncharacterized protein n=1 Tax=Pseudocercospora eumusae TaxID=321146 RepID=A0A139H658_9PEZI|nr:hypothetical protein AC578_4376 [Pseudocercospora eumusae]
MEINERMERDDKLRGRGGEGVGIPRCGSMSEMKMGMGMGMGTGTGMGTGMKTGTKAKTKTQTKKNTRQASVTVLAIPKEKVVASKRGGGVVELEASVGIASQAPSTVLAIPKVVELEKVAASRRRGSVPTSMEATVGIVSRAPSTVLAIPKIAASRRSSRRRSSMVELEASPAPSTVPAIVEPEKVSGKGEYETRQYRRESRSKDGQWEVWRKGSYAYWRLPRRLN